MKTYTLCGRTYAPTTAALIESLFTGPRTFHGTFKRSRAGVLLYRANGTLEAFIKRDGLFAVSASDTAQGPRYMFGLCSTTEAWLGLPDSLLAQRNAIAQSFSATV